ncbi:hypothetical protein B7P43_G04459 [Cryptotermes secundus]|nr:hypothetical protein B7P43_G04459 [Cryptotermes secundus]
MSDAEYLTAFYQVVLPISYQFSPELVLVSSGFDACIGDPLGGCKVSPEAYGHLTHLLTALAGGRVILSLEGGYNVTSISHAMPMCTKALLGDPLPSLAPHHVACPSAVTSIKNVIRTQARYWSAVCFQVALPQERVVHTEPLEDKLQVVLNVSGGHQGENDEGALITLHHKEETDRDIKVPPSAEQNFEVMSADLWHTLNESLSKFSLDEGQVDPICSDRNTSPMVPSSDSSPVSSSIDIESQMWPKSSSSNFKELSAVDVPFDETEESSVFTLPHTCSISFSDEGYRSEEQYDVTTFHEGTVVPLTVITEHDGMSAADSDGKSSSDRIGEGQQGQSGSTSEDTNETSSQIPHEQTLVNYLSENMQMLLAGEMFAVVPLRSCPHLVQVQPVPECGIDCNSSCAECGSVQENWVCLVCYTVHCGRYISEHMMLHGHGMSHPLTLSFSDLSVWCYACEAYIDNQILYAAKNALHRKKFGEDMPWSYGDADPTFPV